MRDQGAGFFGGLVVFCCALLLACGGRSESPGGTARAGAGGAFNGGASWGPIAGAPAGGSTGGAGGGVFGAPDPAHPCNSAGGSASIGTLGVRHLEIQRNVGTNLPFEQFVPGDSDGARVELAGAGTALRFRDSFVDYDHGGYVYLDLQISDFPRLGQVLTLDPSAIDNLHFQVGLDKAWDAVPGQKITVLGVTRDDVMCLTEIAFELPQIQMQPGALEGNAAQGTFVFDGTFLAGIFDYR